MVSNSTNIFHLVSTDQITAIFQGKSRLILGREQEDTAPGGVEVDVEAGDVIVIPAGVSHRSLTSEDDYRYIGVYPEVGAQTTLFCELITHNLRTHQSGETFTVKEAKTWRTCAKRSAPFTRQTMTPYTAKMDHCLQYGDKARKVRKHSYCWVK